MRENLRLESGIYLNLFPVEVSDNPVRVMVVDRSHYPDLRSLRDDLKRSNGKVWIYADIDRIYGYGDHCTTLKNKSFEEIKISFYEAPRFTGRMILEGFVEKIRQNNYETIERKGRCEVFNWNEFSSTRDGNVKVFCGFDLRSIFLLDLHENKLVFGLVVDVTYAFRDQSNQSLNTYLIRQKFGSQTFSEIRQIQGDLIPTGINTEVARQRLLDQILPFIRRFPEFNLPCGLKAILSAEPVRVVLGGVNP